MSRRMQISVGEECPHSMGGTGIYFLIPQIIKNYRYVGGIYNSDGELLAAELELTLRDAEAFYRMYTKAIKKARQKVKELGEADAE